LHWLSTKLAEQLELDPQQIDPQTEFSDYGLNSIEAVSLSGELENFLGRRLSPTLLWDYPTLESLTQYLTEPTTQEHPAQPIHPPHQLDPIDSQEAQKMLQELDLDHLSDAEVDALLARLLSEEEG
jgi:acyl carrier protein